MVITVATEVVMTSTRDSQPQCCCERREQHTALGNEEPLELVGRDKKNRELDTPEDEMADHALSGDANALWDVVRDVEVRGPDRSDDLGHGSGARVGLDGMPEQGGDGTDDDSEPGEVPAEGGTDGNGVWGVEPSADHTVEHEGNGAHQATEDDADDSLTPREVSQSSNKMGWRCGY